MNHNTFPVLSLVLTLSLAGVFGVAAQAAQPGSAEAPTPAQRLASQYARAALQLLRSEPLTTQAMGTAAIVLDEAAALTPDDANLWRMVLDLASLREDEVGRDRAIEQLIRLDPGDEVVRFKAVNRSIERHQTAEDRAAAYRAQLAPDRRAALGPAVASRLAMDLALLERRRGDSRAFSRWLAEAVSLDPANAAAAAMAAGFFRMNVDDPFAEAELLSALFLANVIDTTSQTALAAHLLNHGAYVGAERLYRMAVATHAAAGSRASDGVVADLAIAQWGRGDGEAALATIRERQREADLLLRRQLSFERPELTSIDRARYSAQLQPALAATRAALRHRMGDEQAERALTQAVQAHEKAIDDLLTESAENADAAVARLRLEAAWTILWLGGDPARAEAFIAAAADFQPLSEGALARFDGWTRLRRGDVEGAIERFEPYIESDPAARLGYATVLLQQQQHRSAARELLAVARAQPGTLIGVWAADRLADLLGRTFVISEGAAALETLIAAIPRAIDRYAEQPTIAVSMRLTPTKTTFAAYEPILLAIEITNHTPIPMSIDPAGPIKPQLVLRTTAQITGAGRADAGFHVVEINRRLRLLPRERVTIHVDLRQTYLGAILDQVPARGAMVRVKATLNPIVMSNGALLPGVLGSEVDTPLMRIDGARLTRAWVDDAIATMISRNDRPDLPRLALLSFLAAGDPGPETPEADRQLLEDARSALAEVFSRLDGVPQAWLLGVMPTSPTLDTMLAMGRRSDHRQVRLAYLLFRLRDRDDPMLDAARRGDDPTFQRLAGLLTILLQQQAAAEQQRLQQEQQRR